MIYIYSPLEERAMENKTAPVYQRLMGTHMTKDNNTASHSAICTHPTVGTVGIVL